MAKQQEGANYSSADISLGNGAARKIYFRTNTSDITVIQTILVNRQYDLGRLRRSNELKSFLERRKTTGKAPLVIDAGANIGASSIFFAAIIPDAVVVAIEPDAENFKLLSMNVEGLRVKAIRAAVSATPGLARVVDPGEGHWGFRTENLSDGIEPNDAVPRRTVNEMYRLHSKQCFPFVVKIDIEGGEADLFTANTEWIAITPILIVELHDWLLPKSGTSRAFLQRISPLNRDFIVLGEDIYSIANDLG
jgi:FkbM family methyltransferase